MKIFKALWPLLVLALVLAGCGEGAKTPKSDANSLVSFKFEAAKNAGKLTTDAVAAYDDVSGKWKVGPLPAGTNVSSLIATFEISALASAKVGLVDQVSGTTANNFGSDLVYTVTAEDGTAATYTIWVAVTVASSAKEITAFALDVNSSITAATINGTAIGLTVRNGTNVGALVATFTLSDTNAVAKVGLATQSSGTTPNDFTNPVDYVVTAQDLSTTTYTVTVTVLPPEKLMFTEYFEGLSNNKYLEITNTGTTDIDLSAYSVRLVYHDASNVPNTANDASKTLAGTLGAGKSVTYANTSFSTTTLTVLNALSTTPSATASWRENVVDASNISYFNGNDPLVLLHSGIEVDRIGPADDSNFGADLMLIRKPGVAPIETFDSTQWNAFSFGTANLVGDDWSAGTYTAAATGSTIRLFAINGVRATIGSTTVAVTLPAGATASSLVANFSTEAGSVLVGATPQVSNLTANDFTSPVSYVVSTGGTTTTYIVTVTVMVPVNYVTTNYAFDGGISAARTAILAGGALDFTVNTSAGIGIKNLDGSGTWVASTNEGVDTSITGIVTQFTSGNLYIQDQNTAICFYKSNAFASPGFKVGDKVTITNARAGYAYFGLIEVTKFGIGGSVAPAITVDQTGNDIYYIDTTTSWETDSSLRVIRYSGTITTAATGSSPYRGSFDSDTNRRFKTTSASLVTSLGLGATTTVAKSYYGIVDVYKFGSELSGYPYILLLSTDQIR
jgi:hypothetical protein